ncbi:MAG: hypothetical protein V4739_06955 [Pseudomonadota bacterium]
MNNDPRQPSTPPCRTRWVGPMTWWAHEGPNGPVLTLCQGTRVECIQGQRRQRARRLCRQGLARLRQVWPVPKAANAQLA